jgi:hypothetical protein
MSTIRGARAPGWSAGVGALQGRGKSVCRMAREYLLEFREEGLTAEILDEYLDPSREALRPRRMKGRRGLYRRLLGCAQDANMRAGHDAIVSVARDAGVTP